MRFKKHFAIVSSLSLVISFLVLLNGCGAPAEKPAEKPKTDAAAPATASDKTAAEANDAFKELSSADRELALKQKVCPVTGEKLGSMGPPVKVEVKGRTVFLCCAGCVDEIKKNPEKYFAILDAAK